jgi:aspartate carbamoyltransferase catalytic subunit
MEQYTGKSIIYTQQFTPSWCDKLFKRADELKQMIELEVGGKLKYKPSLWEELTALRQEFSNKLVIVFFYEKSTRTYTSFNAAALKWRMRVIGIPDAQFSSVAKGESLKHTIQILGGYYPDAMVIRFKNEGEAETAARISEVPIVNAGDGSGQHPTQALLDLYTIERELGRNNNLTVLMGGDLLHGRTVHSLSYLLSKYPGIKLIFVSPPELKMADKIKFHLQEKGVVFTEMDSLQEACKEADVVYWTRIQKERFTDLALYDKIKGQYVIGNRQMLWTKPEAILMHPLPINSADPEILPEVDNHPQQRYIKQAQNGLWVRMALLECVVTGNCSN